MDLNLERAMKILFAFFSIFICLYFSKYYYKIGWYELFRRIWKLGISKYWRLNRIFKIVCFFFLLVFILMFYDMPSRESVWLEYPLWITWLIILVTFFTSKPTESKWEFIKKNKLLSIPAIFFIILLLLMLILLIYTDVSHSELKGLKSFVENNKLLIQIYGIFIITIPFIFLIHFILRDFFRKIVKGSSLDMIISMVIIWLFVAWIFGVFYSISSSLKYDQIYQNEQEKVLSGDSIDYLYFSITVLTSVVVGDIVPRNLYGKIFVMIESLFGYALLALTVGLILEKLKKELKKQ